MGDRDRQTPTGMQLNVSARSGFDVHAVLEDLGAASSPEVLEDLGAASSPGLSAASVLVPAKAMNSKWGRWLCDVTDPRR